MKDINKRGAAEQEQIRRIIKKLRPIDDAFMRVMLKDCIPVAEHILRIILKNDSLVITEIDTQRDLSKLAGSRAICLDALCTDNQGKKYNIEIQRSGEGANPHRARFHLGALDAENLKAGQDFKELPDTYVIFITERDYMGDGKAMHCFEYLDNETHKPLGDGAHIIYVNGNYRGDDDIGRLMHDFCCADPDKMYFKDIADRAKEFKQSEKGELQMGGILEEMKTEWQNEAMQAGVEQGIEQGVIKGILKANRETALKMLKAGTFTTEQIAEYSGLSSDEVEKIKTTALN